MPRTAQGDAAPFADGDGAGEGRAFVGDRAIGPKAEGPNAIAGAPKERLPRGRRAIRQGDRLLLERSKLCLNAKRIVLGQGAVPQQDRQLLDPLKVSAEARERRFFRAERGLRRILIAREAIKTIQAGG